MLTQGMSSAGVRCAALVIAALAGASATAAEPAKLKFNFFTDEREMTYVTAIKPFLDAVNADGKGFVEFEFYPNGALGRSLPQQGQIVLDGVADAAFIIPAMTPARFPDNGVLELPGLFRDIRESTLVYTRLMAGKKLAGYADYFVIGALGTAPYSIHTRSAAKAMTDFDGMKIATTNPTGAAVLRTLNAVPVPMPVTEITEAIGRGTVDGTILFLGAMNDFGIPRVTSFHYMTQLNVQPLTVMMNRKRFNGLPKAAQDIIAKYSGEWIAARYDDGYSAYLDKVLAELKADPRRHVIVPTAEETAALTKKYQPIYDEWLAKSARSKDLLQAVEAELAKLR
jgi:TRAP-type C4-dicarboxylate transport system substrate-binding protein